MKRRSSFNFPFGQYPAIRLVILFITGILLSSLLKAGISQTLILLLVVSFFYVTIEVVSGRKISVRYSRLSSIYFSLLVIATGFSLSVFENETQKKWIEKLIEVSSWEEIIISGRITEATKNSSGKKRLSLEVVYTEVKPARVSRSKYTSRILWDTSESPEIGDEIKILGTIIPISGPRNPGQFNYREFLSKKGIYTQVRLDSVLAVKKSESGWNWISIRKKALSVIDQNFNTDTAPIAKALLLGYKNELEGETRQAFARSGLSHIMAVSGLHVGLVIAPFWFVIPFFWTKKYGSFTGLVILVVLLFFYAGITGFSTPVIRASVMATLLTYGKLFSKRSDSINLMGVAALILLISDPNQLYDIGFQLSFSAVTIILLVIPVLQSKIPYWVRIKWYGTPVMVIIISVVVQVGLYPLQAYYFGEISIISPVANALFVPLLGIIVPLSLLALILATFLPQVAVLINYPSLVFLESMNAFVFRVADLGWAWQEASIPSALLFILWASVIATIGSWRSPAIRWKWLAVSLSMLLVIQISLLINKTATKEMEVVVFDVGQGDATYIRTPNGKHILIDTGFWRPGANSAEQVLLPFFKSRGINRIDAVFLSHPHADHIGGISELIDNIELGVIYNSGFSYDSQIYRLYNFKAKEKSIPVTSLKAGEEIEIDDSILILVLGPEERIFSDDPNEHSLILNVIYGDSEFLFAGDAGKEQEERLIHNYKELLDTDFLKVGHHGSKTSSGSSFLKEVTPNVATVSVGSSNRFRHPHQEALSRLERTNAEILFTGRDGALIFKSNGAQIYRSHKF